MSEHLHAVFAPCEICGEITDWCCVDCGINSGGEKIPHVCVRTSCRDEHERRAQCRPPAPESHGQRRGN